MTSSVLLLPPDLLENILVLVVRSSLFPGRSALDISHVCSVWRKAALGCPRLWGIIDTRNQKISSLFVSRTRKSTPLDVLVANPYIVKPPSLFSKHDVLRGHCPPGRKQSPVFSFETVLPCLHNIRFLTLYLSYQELRSFSAVFPSSGMELQLASLTIITPPTWDAENSNSMEQTRIAALVPSVFIKPFLSTKGTVGGTTTQGYNNNDGQADGGDGDDVYCGRDSNSVTLYLKSLTLTDISLPWGEISTSLSSLTYLALTSPVLRPSLKQIHLILRRTTLLKRLVLDDVFEDAVLDFSSLLDTHSGTPTKASSRSVPVPVMPRRLGDLSPIFLPHLTSLTYNAPTLQAHWLFLLLSNCIIAPLLDDFSFRTPEMGHLYGPVGEACHHSPTIIRRPFNTAAAAVSGTAQYRDVSTSSCKCRMFEPSQLIPNSNTTKEAFLTTQAQSIDHFMISRDAYNPIRGGKGHGYRFYIHGAAKNIEFVEYPSLIPFLRASSVPFHDPRYFRKFERGVFLSGYAYACSNFARQIVPSSYACSSSSSSAAAGGQEEEEEYTYTCLNPLSGVISGLEALAANLVNVRHLELATGGVEILLMDDKMKKTGTSASTGMEGGSGGERLISRQRRIPSLCKSGQKDIAFAYCGGDSDDSGSGDDDGYGDSRPLGAVRHVTLWGQISSGNSESNVYWRGSDIEKIPPSSSQSGCLFLPDVLDLLRNRLTFAQNRNRRNKNKNLKNLAISSEPLLSRLTLRHFKVEFTIELSEAIEGLLGDGYDIVRVDTRKRCVKTVNGGNSGKGKGKGKLELIDCN